LNKTRLPMRMGFSFLVRCSQKSVVSPILKIARASARVNKRGPAMSLLVWLATKSYLLYGNAPNADASERR
jgi:hypothetical protein